MPNTTPLPVSEPSPYTDRGVAMLDSSRRRATLAAGFFFMLALLVPLAAYVPGFWPNDLVPALRKLLPSLMAVFLGMMLFELLLRHLKKQMMLRTRKISHRMRLISVVLENSGSSAESVGELWLG